MSKINSQINGLPVIHTRAAGIDIGSRFHVVAVPANLSEDPVQTFQAFTADIQRMTDWLKTIGVETVAMESTGVYWVPVFEILEGIKYGVRKVNIDTDLRMASMGAMRRYLAQSENTAELDARKVYKAARDAMQVLCQARYELFGAAGHASKIKAIPLSEMAKRY